MEANDNAQSFKKDRTALASIKILIVEDELITASLLRKALYTIGYKIISTVASGEAALEIVNANCPDMILMDIKLEGELDGIDTAKLIRKDFDIPIIYITAYSDVEILKRASITEPFGYILKPINLRELGMVIEMSMYKHNSEKKHKEKSLKYRTSLERAFMDLTGTICKAIEYRDSYTAGHQKRVAELAILIGKKMGLPEYRIHELYIGGMLHDIGKIGIPMDILSKTTQLTNTEYALIKDHVEIGHNIIKDAKLPWNIKDMVYNHHEKLDGTGYPNGLSGDQISTNVRIITVCDVVEAMATLRPYRAPLLKSDIIGELSGGRGTKYDPDIVDAMISLIDTGEFDPWGTI